MNSLRSRAARCSPATFVAALFCAAAASGCGESGCGTEAPPNGAWQGDDEPSSRAPTTACPPLLSVLLRTSRGALARQAGVDPSGLSVRFCVDSSCEDLPLDAARAGFEGDQPVLAFDLALDDLDARAPTHLAALSIYAPGGVAPLFTAAREIYLESAGACSGSACSACPVNVVPFGVTPKGDEPPGGLPEPEACGGEVVASVRAEGVIALGATSLAAQLCVDELCREATLSFPRGVIAAGEFAELVLPLGARFDAGPEHVIKLSLGYEPGAPVYSEARLMPLDEIASLGCDRSGEPDVVFSIRPESLGTRPPPQGPAFREP